MSMADGPGYGCDPSNLNNGNLCDCIGCAINSIAASMAKIAESLTKKVDEPCKDIDKCTDKILENIKKKIEGPLYSTERCKQMVRDGKAGTLEYAVRCANTAIEQCDAQCSLGDPTSEGQCCKNCGAEKCICKEGVCVPVEKPTPFIGWCNPDTKMVQVLSASNVGPGPPWYQVSMNESESLALAQAQAACQGGQAPGGGSEGYPTSQPPRLGAASPFGCTLTSLLNGSLLQQASGAIGDFNQAGGWVQISTSLEGVGAFGATVGNTMGLATGIVRMLASAPSHYADLAADIFPAVIGCRDQSFQDAFQLMGVASLFQQQSGVPVVDWLKPYQYAMNAKCRQTMLDPTSGMMSYLANGLQKPELDGLWAIAGECPQNMERMLQAKKSKPIPVQLAHMRRRELIDKEGYHRGMREVGYLDREAAESLFDLTAVVPTLTDITRLMVRDADDENIEYWKESDNIFTQKYGKNLKRWGEWQGIPEDFAKLYWRAHWTIPAPGQLMTFLHRLRNKPEFNKGKPLLDRIKEALGQQDILPFWQDYYIATSYKPLTRVDVRRAYDIGALDREAVLQSYSDLGYDDKNAERLTEFTTRLRDDKIANRREIKLWLRFAISRIEAKQRMVSMGLPGDKVEQALDDESIKFTASPYATAFVRGELTRDAFAAKLDSHGVKANAIQAIVEQLSVKIRDNPALDAYRVGTIERSEAADKMTQAGLMPGVTEQLLTQADSDVYLSFVKACQNGIKRRFLLGELDAQDARNELMARKTTQSRANQMVDWWGCELKSGERDVSASTLCSWLGQGTITSVDFVNRLKRIGYSDIDSSLMLQDCLSGISTRRLAQAQKEAKQQAAEQARVVRAVNQQQAAIERETATRKRLAEANRKKREQREKQLFSTVDKLTNKCNCSSHSALAVVRGEKSRVQTVYGLDVDRTLQVLLAAADEFTEPSLENYSSIVSEFAQAAASEDLSSPDDLIVIPKNSNGSTQPSG